MDIWTRLNMGTEINTSKETSENVTRPGIEPGSPDYRSYAFTTRLLNPPH